MDLKKKKSTSEITIFNTVPFFSEGRPSLSSDCVMIIARHSGCPCTEISVRTEEALEVNINLKLCLTACFMGHSAVLFKNPLFITHFLEVAGIHI